MMPFTVVIVNFNGGRSILECLGNLTSEVEQRAVVVVDNASTDGSLRQIHAAFPRVNILPLRRNVGFGRAVNIAAARVQHDGALVTLNPDTKPSDLFVEALVEPLAKHSRLGSTSGTLVFSSDPMTIASAGIRVHRNGVAIDDGVGTRLDTPSHGFRPVFGASGGAAAFRLEAFREAGGFCEPFFLYLEDVDLAWRLRLLGWECVNVRDATAAHDYSSSSGEGSAFKRRFLARNRIWTLARCLPREIWIRDRAAIVAFDLLAAGFGTVTLDTALLRGRAEATARLPWRFRERRWIQAHARVDASSLDSWIQPAIAPRELKRLRNLTNSLARRA
jgi:GT2 family glycosyltransferase